MSDEQPPLVARVTQLEPDLTSTDRLVVAYLAETDGAQTRDEIETAVDATVTATLQRLRDAEILQRRERETDNGGRNPYVHDLSAETRSALDTEWREWDYDSIQRRIVRELAEIHYVRGVSSAKAAQLAREIPGASSAYVASHLGKLAAGDGPVEALKRSNPADYRLVGAGLYSPYRALAEADTATDGGTDR